MQVDAWITLTGLPAGPDILVEFDTGVCEAAYSVAKYLWWTHDGRAAFSRAPALLISAFAPKSAQPREPEPRTFLSPTEFVLHQRVAEHLGHVLEQRVHATAYRLVHLRNEPPTVDRARRLAELAFDGVKAWVAMLPHADH
jgi:hypothetical protein